MSSLALDPAGRKIYEPDGNVLSGFLLDRSPVSIIRGPIGSGSSSASMMKMFQISCEQAPAANGVRYTRWLVVRDSYPNLETTTLKTWVNWFPEHMYGPVKRSKPYFHHLKVGSVDMEVYFLALDDEDAIGKLRSLEITGVFFNELEFAPKEIFDEAISRCGRFPAKATASPTWYGAIADLNAPPEDHWVPAQMGEVAPPEDATEDDMSQYERPKGWCYLIQPPALIEVKGDDGKTVVDYKVNPEAENLKWLPDNYYVNQVKGKTKGWIDSRLMNRIIPRIEGKRVWPEFVHEVHVAQRELSVVPNHPVFVGFDFGRSPGVVFGQVINDRWFIQHEMGAEDISTSQFAPLVVKFLRLKYPGHQVRAWGDPKGADRGQNTDQTAYEVYRANGLMIEKAPVKNNNILTRINVVSMVLNELRDGKPRLLVSPSCRVLVMGMAGGYHYRRIVGTNRYAEEPEKNRFSHRSDALQYLLLGAGEGRNMVSGDRNPGMLGNRPMPVSVHKAHSRRRIAFS
jgi:hypothetical protein